MKGPRCQILLAAGLALSVACTDTHDRIARLATGTTTGGMPPMQMPDAQHDAASPSPDAPVPLTQCEETRLLVADADLLAHYSFDGTELASDATGNHDGEIRDGSGFTVAGPAGCDQALGFSSAGHYMSIADSPDWDLPSGAVDFWLLPPAPDDAPYGLVSRDTDRRDAPGHLTFMLSETFGLTVRLQAQGEFDQQDGDAVRCAIGRLQERQWAHIAFNFGPEGTQLFINGQPVNDEGDPGVDIRSPCGTEGVGVLAGNDLPWVVGIAANRTTAPFENLTLPMTGGAIDELRISRARLFGQ